ncbi:N-acetylglucosamine-6-phosphate deacetylase, partial [Streptomyces sp. NPDC058832]
MAPSKVLAGARVVLPTGTVDDGRVIVDGTRIADTAPPGAEVVDVSGHWVVPGFVDIQQNSRGPPSQPTATTQGLREGNAPHRPTPPT